MGIKRRLLVWDSAIAHSLKSGPRQDMEVFGHVYDPDFELITPEGSLNEYYIRNVSTETVRYAGLPSSTQELEFVQDLRHKLFMTYCYMMDRRNRPRSLDIYSMDELFRLHALSFLRYFRDQRISHFILGVPSLGYDLIASEAIRHSGGKCVFVVQQHYGKFAFATRLDDVHLLRKRHQIFGGVKVDLTDKPVLPWYMVSSAKQAKQSDSILGRLASLRREIRARKSSARREIRVQEQYLLGQMSGGKKLRRSKLDHFLLEQAHRQTLELECIPSPNEAMRARRARSGDVKICLLALQVPGEAANAFADNQWLNPVYQLDKLLTALPDNWKIWVKPHPKQPRGFWSFTFWESMLISGRVEVIDPDTLAGNLFSDLSLVATVNGTVGWEAVHQGIPAVIFGSAWYQGLPGVIHVDQFQSVGDLPNPESWSIAQVEVQLMQKSKQMAPGFINHLDYTKSRGLFYDALQKPNPLEDNQELVTKSLMSILDAIDREP